MSKRSGIQLSDYPPTLKMRLRFWSKVIKTEDDSCWEWKASFGFRDYGKFKVGPTYVAAHRVSYYLTYGPFDKNLNVCHKCDNPKCVRPDHLFLGTVADNNYDKILKGRHSYICPTAPLAQDKVDRIRELAKGKRNQKEIALQYGVERHVISRILNHKGAYHE